MFNKVLILFLGLTIGVMGFSSKADAVYWENITDTPTSLHLYSVDLLSDMTYTGDYWDVSIDVTHDLWNPEDPDDDEWFITYYFTHLVNPDTLESNHNTIIEWDSFPSKTDYSKQIDLSYIHPDGDDLNEDNGTLVFNYSYLDASIPPDHVGEFTIDIVHAPVVVPEPISSTLFLIGGATLGFRRFRKKFKK